MIIKSFFNTTEQQIDTRQWNPYLGISINNKAFTCDYIAGFMKWALPRSREHAAVVVVDIIQHINNEVFDRSKPISAIEKAFRKADDIHHLCDEARSRLEPHEAERLVILDWTDIVYDEYFQHNLMILKKEYEQNLPFREALQAITRRNLGTIISRMNESQIETLTHYLLYELPELITGFRHEGTHYNLNVYPGKIASIYAELLELDFFHHILAKLRLIGDMASVEAYIATDAESSDENAKQ